MDTENSPTTLAHFSQTGCHEDDIPGSSFHAARRPKEFRVVSRGYGDTGTGKGAVLSVGIPFKEEGNRWHA